MTNNIELKGIHSIEVLCLIQRARDLFWKDLQVLESYPSGLDYEKWSNNFYDSIVEATEAVKKVFSEIVELEVNKAVGEP